MMPRNSLAAFPNKKIQQDQAIDLVMQLLAIPGGSGQEAQVMQFIKDQLRQVGCPASAIRHDCAHKASPLGGEVGNLIVKLRGTRRGPRRLFAAHTDTVPICVGTKPLRKGDIIQSGVPGKGLGADDRSGVAAILYAACELLRRKLPHPPLTFAFMVQEEAGVIGARLLDVPMLGKPTMAFNFDGSGSNKLFIGATGSHHLSVTIEGIPAHAGVRPQEGVSAITLAANAIAELHAEGWLGLVEKGNQRGAVNVGTIDGGSANNVVAPTARLTVGIRSHSTTFRNRLLKRVKTAFERSARQLRNAQGGRGSVSFQDTLAYESFRLKQTEPTVQMARSAMRQATGQPVELGVLNGGLDANWLTQHGIPTVTISTGQHKNHTADEYLDLHAYTACCETALHLATQV
ncbi:M20/M25/M40 family metallo-hydrolase [Phycisphaerales bacterium AB-hyl4]|uniref:M20/M25/M40 family metallo-hydrolase n=1 Tax=Natronomicrosphaera hydrolytica TaxID=3242702 RepID=A0ABV4UB98_9BACT